MDSRVKFEASDEIVKNEGLSLLEQLNELL